MYRLAKYRPLKLTIHQTGSVLHTSVFYFILPSLLHEDIVLSMSNDPPLLVHFNHSLILHPTTLTLFHDTSDPSREKKISVY